jgi:hypothetical protein
VFVVCWEAEEMGWRHWVVLSDIEEGEGAIG